MPTFADLPSVAFQHRVEHLADNVYRSVFGPVKVLRIQNDLDPDRLDQELGVDTIVRLPAGTRITCQEKFRDSKYLSYDDVVFEVLNGDYRPGEWSTCTAQMRLVCWADESGPEPVLVRWRLYDELRLRMAIDTLGGIHRAGKALPRRKGSAALAFAVPLDALKAAELAGNP
jgi:hypothetical protein